MQARGCTAPRSRHPLCQIDRGHLEPRSRGLVLRRPQAHRQLRAAGERQAQSMTVMTEARPTMHTTCMAGTAACKQAQAGRRTRSCCDRGSREPPSSLSLVTHLASSAARREVRGSRRGVSQCGRVSTNPRMQYASNAWPPKQQRTRHASIDGLLRRAAVRASVQATLPLRSARQAPPRRRVL